MIVRCGFAAVLVLFLGAFPVCGQDIRSPDINTESEQGKLLAQAGMTSQPSSRVSLLQEFVTEYPDDPLVGYAYFQLLKTHTELEQHAEAVEAGKKLLEIVPDDLEVRHLVNQAMVNAQMWDELHESLAATRPLAEAEVAAEKPAGASETEVAQWQAQHDYAAGVVDWLEWATNTAMTQQTDPAAKIAWLDHLREDYPDSEYSEGIEARYVAVYQQMGNEEKVYEWMAKAVEGDGEKNLDYLYSLSQNELYNKENADQAIAYGEAMLEELEARGEELPEGDRAKYDAYANFMIGSAWVSKNNNNAYRTGRSHLLQTVDYIKAEGGPRYNILAYYLGTCYVALDIQGDNIQKALHWMTEAANSPGPFQQQGKDALAKIKSAI